MQREKLTFTGHGGEQLAGALEKPVQGKPRGYALFAHCFSCGKDIAAASRISKALVDQGFAVLRFDFTGLGDSEGDFGNTNFTTNVQDLVAAAGVLKDSYEPAMLLIGHSLGGAAVLAASGYLPDVRAVVTIGAPASPDHVLHHLEKEMAAIEEQGSAPVKLGPRTFNIRKQFLDDISSHSLKTKIRTMNKALLVFHSPHDTTVNIDEARKIFKAASHPKSFVSLDNADHLLTRKADANYVANTIAAWAERYLDVKERDKRPAVKSGQVLVEEENRAFTRKVTTDHHQWLADEPEAMGGENLGPDPYEMLLASLGACTSMTIRMYAGRKNWPLEDVRVELSHHREHLDDCADNCDDGKKTKQLDVIERRIALSGPLDQSQQARLMEIAHKCPVHKTLHGTIVVRDEQVPE
ncbi:bifunctional alpha/beta hydrolase/OsmC family protein [Kiloniella sp. b19]|uniref:bifunctional alpha/beta hydrolase/OsmC family protein n=1 Tax=Kiloniella sp. GXU_MW_B19 TaxID=3141326 RepID=UPI0031D95318